MMSVLRTSLRRPAPLIGSLIALILSALIIVIAAAFIGTGAQATGPVDRLAGAAVVVTGDQQLSVHADGQRESIPLPGYRRLPVTLAARIASVPGVAAAVPDLSFPVALSVPGGRVVTGLGAAPLTGHSWASSQLTPFRLTAGAAPVASGEIVVGGRLAKLAHLRVGELVRLAGQELPALRVTGIASDGQADAASASSVFFSPAQAAVLYGHPGQADLIGVVTRPGTRPAAVAARVRAVTGGRYPVVTGKARGAAQDPAIAGDSSDIEGLGGSAGADIMVIALFVVAGTIALSVSQRHRQFALLRAVGATPGQVRLGVLAEQLVLGVAGGVAGWLPGCWLASLAVRGMVSHKLLPAGTSTWLSPWLLFIAVTSGMVIGMLSGLLAARRAGRAAPADALRESVAERRWPNPMRTLLGLAGLGGSGALVVAIIRSGAGAQEIGTALSLLLTLIATIALLGPILIALAELLLRWLARTSGVTARLALASVRAQPRRMASAMLPIALSLSFAGTVYFLDASLGHTAVVQQSQRLTAAQVVTAPGPGLALPAVTAIERLPGARGAVGLTSAPITVADPDLDTISGEVVSGGSLPDVLNLQVTAGQLARLGPGQVAVSAVEASAAGMNTRVGDRITVWLPDGAPYRATVSAIYSRSFGFADILLPASAATGHLQSLTSNQILVPGDRPRALAALRGRFPGLEVASRRLVNVAEQREQSQGDYLNNLILASIILLAVVTVVNTLVMTTLDRRRALLLLRRIGATTGQLLRVTFWQSALVAVTGILLGLAAGGVTLTVMTKAISGNLPYIPVSAGVGVVGTALALTLAGTMLPTSLMLRQAEPGQ
jgi:putative ABC transport system permease protein